MSRFLEYVNSKNKLAKPVVDPTGDQIDPKSSPVKPPKAKNRYKPGVTNPKTPGKGNWGDMGEKSLIYKPDLKNHNGCTPAKIPTAEQIQISNNFIEKLAKDPTLIETFIRQLKINGLFGAMVAEVFDQRETSSHLSEVLAHETYGPKLHKTLKNALKEEVSKPFGDQLQDGDGDDDEDDEDDPFKDEEEDDEDHEDEEGSGDDNLDVSHEDEEGLDANQDPNMDPNMMGIDPNMMDPNTMAGIDPNMMGMDPNMQGMDPSMMGQMPPQPQMPQPANPMMGAPSMMRAYQRAMMRANMGKR